MIAAPILCRWCGRACRPRCGRSPRSFCTSGCRTAFHTAARRWAERALASGALTIDELRSGDPAACTLPPRGNSTATAPDIGDEDDALSALLSDILDALSPEKLAELPDPVWALLDFFAGPDADGPEEEI